MGRWLDSNCKICCRKKSRKAYNTEKAKLYYQSTKNSDKGKWVTFKTQAKRRGFYVGITKDEFNQLVKQECF